MSGLGLFLSAVAYVATVGVVWFRANQWVALLTAIMIGAGCLLTFTMVLSVNFGCDGTFLRGLFNCPEGVRESLAYKVFEFTGEVSVLVAIISIPVSGITLIAACVVSFARRR